MSSTVKREKRIGERLGELKEFGKSFGMQKRKDLQKAMLRHPARDPAELDAVVLAQINEGERSLLLQRQLWH
jgi:hypothetical protein